MADTLKVDYLGDLRCKSVLGQFPALISDGPKQFGGLEANLSPTDIVSTALGACLLTMIGAVAKGHKIDLPAGSIGASVVKEMAAPPERRIGKFTVAVTLPARLAAEERAKLEKGAAGCPVKASLHPGIQIDLTFNYV